MEMQIAKSTNVIETLFSISLLSFLLALILSFKLQEHQPAKLGILLVFCYTADASKRLN